jgi:tetratricopeptide (TPR) repeat protein
LAQRGAYYSARAEFIHALRLVAQALDAQSVQPRHSAALAAGIRALNEAQDFVPRGAHVEADLQVDGYIASHRTPVLKNAGLNTLTSLVAMQSYYAYAQEQLAAAGGYEPAASRALFALGKIQPRLDEVGPVGSLDGPKSMALYQAALVVDRRNADAGNELGVLMVRYGQLDDARQVFLQTLSVTPRPETWHNLAVVHERLGEPRLAALAWKESTVAGAGRDAARDDRTVATKRPAKATAVQWVDATEFTRTSAQQAPGPGRLETVSASSATPRDETQQPAKGGLSRWWSGITQTR